MTVLVLDCDGVVVRGHRDGGRWDRSLEADLGLRPTLLQEHFFRPHWRRIASGEADLMAALEQVWPALDCAASPRAFVDYWFATDAALDHGVLAEVAAWRETGGKAFLATVQEHNRARYLMETLGLSRHFDAILYSAEMGAMKPDMAFYQRAQARLPAGEVIFLDDTPVNVEAAQAFGWRAGHFRSVADLRAALRDFSNRRAEK